MNKFFQVSFVVAAFALGGCEVVDPLVGGSEVATVISVNHDDGRCVVSFQRKKDNRLYVSVPATPYKSMRCSSIRPGHTVPIATDPVIGDYPYVLFESVDG